MITFLTRFLTRVLGSENTMYSSSGADKYSVQFYWDRKYSVQFFWDRKFRKGYFINREALLTGGRGYFGGDFLSPPSGMICDLR